jgi:acetylornithine deacetylase/succinyl-diaminopimelate desuccinylase-like protein
MQETLNYINENKQRFVDELFELLRIPSISADPAYKDDVLKCGCMCRTP